MFRVTFIAIPREKDRGVIGRRNAYIRASRRNEEFGTR